jgi:hypothetical protein
MSKRLYKIVAVTGVVNFVNVDHIVRVHETTDKTGTRILFTGPDNTLVIKKSVAEVAAEIEKLL